MKPMASPWPRVWCSSLLVVTSLWITSTGASQSAPPSYRPQDYPWKIAQRLDSGRVVVMLSSDDGYDLSAQDRASFGAELGPAAAKFLSGIQVAPMEWVQRATGTRIHAGDVWDIDAGNSGWFSSSIEQGVSVSAGCGSNGAAVAQIAPAQQAAFARDSYKYFAARAHEGWTRPNEGASVGTSGVVLTVAQRFEVESLLTNEAASATARILSDEAANPHGDKYEQTLNTWRGIYQRVLNGEAKMTYDTQMFRLTSDREPRLFVRGRWQLGGRTVFLLSLWVRVGATLVVESTDTSASRYPWFGEFRFDNLDLANLWQILNVTDVDRDGFAEILMLNRGYESILLQLVQYPLGRNGERKVIATFGAGC